MPDAQVIAAIAVRVEADISSYTETMRAVRTGAEALEKTPVVIKVKLDTGNEFARVREQIAGLQGVSATSRATQVPRTASGGSGPSYTVDGRGFLVNSAGFPGTGGSGPTWGSRFSVGNAGSQAANPQQFSQQINQSVNTLVQAWTQQTVNLMKSLTQNISQQFANTVNTNNWTGGNSWTNTTNNQWTFNGPGSRSGGNRRGMKGFGIFGPTLRGFASSIGMLSLTGAADATNAYLDRNLAINSTIDPLEQSRAEMFYQRSHGLPVVGEAGSSIRSAINAGRQWVSGNLSDNWAGRLIGNAMMMSTFDSTTQQDVTASQNNAERSNTLADARHVMDSAHILANGQIATASAGFDTIAKQTVEIATNLEKAKLDTNDFYQKILQATGISDSSDDARPLKAARDQAIRDAVALADAQRENLQRQTEATRTNLVITQGSANARIALGGAINNPLANQKINIVENYAKLAAKLITTPESLRPSVQAAGLAQTYAEIASYQQNISDSRYNLGTRQQIAALHIGANGLTSDQYLTSAGGIIARGRAMARDVQLAPDELREAIRATGIAELRAERADLTRVGSRTYAESVDAGYTSIAGMQSTGESAEELRNIKTVLDDQLAELKKISGKGGGTIGS